MSLSTTVKLLVDCFLNLLRSIIPIFLTFDDLQFYFKQVFSVYLLLRIVSCIYKELPFILEIDCTYFFLL